MSEDGEPLSLEELQLAQHAANDVLNILIHKVYDENLPVLAYLFLAGWALATLMEAGGRRQPIAGIVPALEGLVHERQVLFDKRKAGLM